MKIVLILILFIIVGCLNMDCETTVEKRVINSNGVLQAIRIMVDCGATTTPGRAIRIVESSDTTDKGIPANTIVGATASTELHWKSNDTLLISRIDTTDHAPKTIFSPSKNTGKVVIIYTNDIVNSKAPCKKCDIEKVKIIDTHLGSLTFQMISDFLCTIDSSCKNNIEFSECSNELLFKVLEKAPELFIEVISKEQMDNKVLLHEIENPVRDLPSLQNIHDKFKVSSLPEDLRIKYLNAFIAASDKNNLKIK